jgi:hypothetical protein
MAPVAVARGGASSATTRPRLVTRTVSPAATPFDFSRTVEFMAGAGPELEWQLSGARHTRSLAAELELDFMFWRTRNVGWYVEPSYDFTGFRATSDRSLGLAVGLIIGVP